MLERDGGSFGLSLTWVMITPDFEIVTEYGVIVIVEKDSLLTCVTVPPFVLSFEVDVVIVLAGFSGFANSRLSIDPDASDS